MWLVVREYCRVLWWSRINWLVVGRRLFLSRLTMVIGWVRRLSCSLLRPCQLVIMGDRRVMMLVGCCRRSSRRWWLIWPELLWIKLCLILFVDLELCSLRRHWWDIEVWLGRICLRKQWKIRSTISNFQFQISKHRARRQAGFPMVNFPRQKFLNVMWGG